ncbi:MAG: TlpA family protein disulfide reductase [Pseudarcicella sp.]|jgi:thiol-disulfide isomerase/thioredoxin|nr:TlpA family protein disulfide reductase [Pseudarcicella sp.]MBP6410933.1 TlpA family protein disulfide reductase [Pseudarcicella sp.]
MSKYVDYSFNKNHYKVLRKNYLKLILLILGIVFFNNPADAQNISKQSYEALTNRVNKHKDTTFLLHFWATWCKPCVKEIAQFDIIADECKLKKAKVILVCLDAPDQLENSVAPFLKSKNIVSEVVVLKDTDMNLLVNAIHPDWSGAIPMSVLIAQKNRKKILFEGELANSNILDRLKAFCK